MKRTSALSVLALVSVVATEWAFLCHADAALTELVSVPGIDFTSHYPPDPVIAVGPQYVVTMVNSAFAIYDKNGNQVASAKSFDDWWASVADRAEFKFDPKLAYDPYAGRWLMLALAKTDVFRISSYLLSVSRDSNPLHSWCYLNLDATIDEETHTYNWADYPDLGFDSSDGIYITSNQYAFGKCQISGADCVDDIDCAFGLLKCQPNIFQYPKVRILSKSELYDNANSCPSSVHWTDISGPALQNADGSPAVSVRAAQMLTDADGEYLVNTAGGNAVTLWSLSGSLTSRVTRVATVSIGAYSPPVAATQPGGVTGVDAGDGTLGNAIYQNGKLYTAFTDAYDWGSGPTDSIRYLRIDTSTGSPEINARYGADGEQSFYPAMTPDAFGNIIIGFSRSSSTEYPQFRYTGRLTTEGQLEASASLKDGGSTYKLLDPDMRNRWGDYMGIASDPSDRSKVWIFGEYAKESPQNTWGTWIGEVSFESSPSPDCSGIGNCQNGGTCTGLNKCTCPTKFAGVNCSQCAPNYYNYPTCSSCSATATCNGNGNCTATGACDCYSGWTGSACQTPVVDHTIAITSGPSTSANPVSSGGTVTLSVSAIDSLGLPLTYLWTAECPAFGIHEIISNGSVPNPPWRAPVNSGPQRDCTIYLVVFSGNGVPGVSFAVAGGFFAQTIAGSGGTTTQDRIVNGGFETLGFSWVVLTNGANQTDSWWNINNPSGAYDGNRYEYLGAKIDGITAANNVDGVIYQTVYIPSGCNASAGT